MNKPSLREKLAGAYLQAVVENDDDSADVLMAAYCLLNENPEHEAVGKFDLAGIDHRLTQKHPPVDFGLDLDTGAFIPADELNRSTK